MQFKHLKTTRLTYCDHFQIALTFSMKSFCCFVGFLVHAIYPDSFENLPGDMINEMNRDIQQKRRHIYPTNL